MAGPSLVFPDAIYQRLPRAALLPRLPLGCWPTPLRRLEALGDELGVDLWVKCDDVSNAHYGGNKVRKLEFMLAHAMGRNCRSIVTFGGTGSNHVIAAALFGRQLRLPIHAVVVPQPQTETADENYRFAQQLGVHFHRAEHFGHVPLRTLSAALAAPRPFIIGPGGSSPLANIGYVFAALELKQQLIEQGLDPPDRIFVPIGSCGTIAGLLVGLAIAELDVEVVGVRVADRIAGNRFVVGALARGTIRLLRRLGERVPDRLTPYRLEHRQFGRAYGAPTLEAREACRIAQDLGELKLETTYSGKAMAALIASCRERPSERILFWNTHSSRAKVVPTLLTR